MSQKPGFENKYCPPPSEAAAVTCGQQGRGHEFQSWLGSDQGSDSCSDEDGPPAAPVLSGLGVSVSRDKE